MVDATQNLSVPTRDRLPVFKIFGMTFGIFGQAPALFFLFSLVPAVPGLIRLYVLGVGSQQFSASMIVVIVVNLVLLYLFQTAMTYTAYRVYGGHATSLSEAFGVGLRRFFPMLGTMILTMLAVYGGFLLLVVPGIIFACMFAVTAPVCALEPLGPVESMKRSSALTKGSRWRILGVYVLFFIPLILATTASTLLLARAGHVLAGLVINAVISIFWTPIATIFSAAIYIELRRLREHAGVATVFD